MATRKRDRIIALCIALFFFALASGLSIMVIVQAITTKHNTNQTDVKSAEKKTVQGTQMTNFTPTNDVKALKITDTKAGSGQAAKAGDKVTVLYTGAVASTGTIFQSTTDTGQPASLDLNSVIKGWQDGIPGMKIGGTRRLLIPADQAYGANPPSGSGIPANAPLVFDITLLKIGG